MLRSSAVFDALALPYDLLTRHPVWQRHRERMAQELPEGARHVLDLGCGPGISTAKLPAGSGGGDSAMSMLRRGRRHDPRMPLVALDAAAFPGRSGAPGAGTLHRAPYLLPDRP